jgi:voltage-gated potassium channel
VGEHERVTSAHLATARGAPSPPEEVDPRLARWERRANPVIILAALVPVVVGLAPRTKNDPFVVLNIVSWLVFLVDLIVHLRFKHRYLRTGLGQFDLFIVVLTFPWYLIPALAGAGVLGLARLGRIIRLIWSTGTSRLLRRLVERIGKAGLYSLGLILVCSEVVYRVEPPSSGFATQGDAVWWGFVTFTTVGYGDLVPVTATGRTVAVFLMLAGVALIGLLAGSLAEFLSDSDDEKALTADAAAEAAAGADAAAHADTDEGADAGAPVPGAPVPAGDAVLLAEVRALRTELAELRDLIAKPPDVGPADS